MKIKVAAANYDELRMRCHKKNKQNERKERRYNRGTPLEVPSVDGSTARADL